MNEATRPCPTCGGPMPRSGRVYPKYCSDACKPRCAVDGCDNPKRKRGWCASHYAQWRSTGQDPKPFIWKWSDRGGCLNCGTSTKDSLHRKYCSDSCRVAFDWYGGPRPTSTSCVACNVEIDLLERTKSGQLRKTSTKFCRRCAQDYDKYKMSAPELALRDGTDCGICGNPVDMSLTKEDDGLMCPSVDHIVPRARGGSHEPSNLQLAHLVCNMRKSDRVMPVT